MRENGSATTEGSSGGPSAALAAVCLSGCRCGSAAGNLLFADGIGRMFWCRGGPVRIRDDSVNNVVARTLACAHIVGG